MRVLFLHTNRQDYLADTLLHGLKQLLGSNCVDVPRYDSLYRPLGEGLRSKLRGHGFSLYGLLEEDPNLVEERFYWQKDYGQFDLYVIANIWFQFDQFLELSHCIHPSRIAVLDGLDVPPCFPYAWRLTKTPWAYLAPVQRCHYFKRELQGAGQGYGLGRFLPRQLRSFIPAPAYAKPIAFSFPKEKITYVRSEDKSQDFNRDIVDQEVAPIRRGEVYPFAAEAEYYADLQRSRFGVTTKRGGWDCLRHYEMAANGCVLAFRDLDQKESTCAPHGLEASNCLIYHDKEHLMQQVQSMAPQDYHLLQQASYRWIESQTTVNRAREFLQACTTS